MSERIAPADDTVPCGFASLDAVLGGGFRREDLIVLAGDVASGKSALALAMALRTARAGLPVLHLSGEMSAERLRERAVAIDARVSVDDLRQDRLDEQGQASAARAMAALGELPLVLRSMEGDSFTDINDALDMVPRPRLVVVDSLQLAPSPRPASRIDERLALTVRALKALAIDREFALLVTAQLPGQRQERPDPRPRLDDLDPRGAVKQTADVVLGLFREEMYRPGQGVEGATELIVAKNRNGPIGFVDLYFYARWLRFEDMLDPDR